MISSMRASRRAIGWGLLAVVIAIVAMIPTLRDAGWSLTVLPRVDSRTALGVAARRIDPGFHTVHPGAYDGQYYWGEAIDPFAAGNLHNDFDKPSYRYGHPLYGWLAWILSAGQVGAVPAALVLIGVVALFVAVTTAAAFAAASRFAWTGLLVALNVGLISSVTHDLGEPLAGALLIAALAAHAHGRVRACWLLLALLPLAKEPLLLVVVALATWELARGERRRAGMFVSAALPALAWWVYARIRLGAWFTSGGTALGRPLEGWWHALSSPRIQSHESVFRADMAAAALAALLVLLAVAALRAFRLRSPADYAYLALAAVALCLAPNATAAFTTALRNTAFLVLLVPLVWSPVPVPGWASKHRVAVDRS